jgi:C-terminal processing protease CtpA/Prc
MIGFNVPPAQVGGVVPNSPAQVAGLQTGDEIWTYDGKRQYDWTKVQLNVALSGEGEKTPIEVKRKVDGKEQIVPLTITPRREREDSRGFLSLGIYPPRQLAIPKDAEKDPRVTAELVPAEQLAMNPGDTIVAIDGRPVNVKDYVALDQAVQASFGREIALTVKDKDGKQRTEKITPQFAPFFGSSEFHLLGMMPRAEIAAIEPDSSARNKLLPGDAVKTLTVGGDDVNNPTIEELVERLKAAGEKGAAVRMIVVRDGKEQEVTDLKPNIRLQTGGKGLGIRPGMDADHAVVGGVVNDSAAATAGITPGSTILKVNGQDV